MLGETRGQIVPCPHCGYPIPVPLEPPVSGATGWILAGTLTLATAILFGLTSNPLWLLPLALAPLALLFNINARLRHLEQLQASPKPKTES